METVAEIKDRIVKVAGLLYGEGQHYDVRMRQGNRAALAVWSSGSSPKWAWTELEKTGDSPKKALLALAAELERRRDYILRSRFEGLEAFLVDTGQHKPQVRVTLDDGAFTRSFELRYAHTANRMIHAWLASWGIAWQSAVYFTDIDGQPWENEWRRPGYHTLRAKVEAIK